MNQDAFDRDLHRAVRLYFDAPPPQALETWMLQLPSLAAGKRRSFLLRIVRLFLSAAAVIVVASLGLIAMWTRLEGPAAPSGQPLTIAVEPSSAIFNICANALLEPVLIERSQSAVVFVSVTTKMTVDIVWPRGTQALLVDGRAELFAPDQTLIGTEGQTLDDLGGAGSGGYFHVCQIGQRVYLP